MDKYNILVGSFTPQEALEMHRILKVIVVGQRARLLGCKAKFLMDIGIKKDKKLKV